MTKITDKIKTTRLYFDGGTGSVLQEMGLPAGTPPEKWNLENPEKISQLHKSYLEAGSDIIVTNTFGVNSLKYDNYEEMIMAAYDCAKKATDGYEDKYIAFDIGPLGRMLKPLGNLDFEDAVSVYSNGIKVAVKCGVDLIIIETMSDCYETKAAVLAAKENCNLPVFVTNAYDESGKLMTGADPVAMIAMLEGLGVDALGINCSVGPDKMLELIPLFNKYSSLPIIVNPNAGLPEVKNGETIYNIDAEEFSDLMAQIAQKGGMILGGCCGTTPEYIKKTIEKTRNIEYKYPNKKDYTLVSSYTHAVEVDESPILIGERINPTGKKKIKEALRTGDFNFIFNEGISQAEKGVHILDVNAGLPEIDEVETMKKVVFGLQSITDVPLQIDTTDSRALESSMRIYNGKPLVNSVNGKQESMDCIFPLVKKYGGVVIALTMDENGIPSTAQERLNIAKKIIDEAAKYGIDKKDVIADPLALTVSSNPDGAIVTLQSIKLIREQLGIKTSLGVSNISFGLPNRNIVNSTFFSIALENGLNCAIMNPFAKEMMNIYYAFKTLKGFDNNCSDYIAYAAESEDLKPNVNLNNQELTLQRAVVKGLVQNAQELTVDLLKTQKPLDIINNFIIPALNEVGDAFEKKTAFLPQLLMSAEAASASFKVVKEAMPKTKSDNSKTIVLATVKGDIHDIGKNIVKVLLESYGFNVVDLGRDVAPETVCDKVKQINCKLVGLSALMTTTVPAMEETIKQLRISAPECKVVVGGAVLTQEYADMIGADKYAKDAMETVRYAQVYFK